MDIPSEYPVGIQRTPQYHPDNIGWAVRLTDGYRLESTIFFKAVYTSEVRYPLVGPWGLF